MSKTPKGPIPFDRFIFSALYSAILEYDGLPYILAKIARVDGPIPSSWRTQERITLNIAPHATGNLCFGDTSLTFRARFNGRDTPVEVHYDGILGMYDHLTGQGRGFAVAPAIPEAGNDDPGESSGSAEPATETPPPPADALIGEEPTPPDRPIGGNVVRFPRRR